MKIQIINYSEKAIALKGDTKAVKEELKALGGRFNPKLTDEAGSKFAGWVFPKTKKEAIEKFLQADKSSLKISSVYRAPAPANVPVSAEARKVQKTPSQESIYSFLPKAKRGGKFSNPEYEEVLRLATKIGTGEHELVKKYKAQAEQADKKLLEKTGNLIVKTKFADKFITNVYFGYQARFASLRDHLAGSWGAGEFSKKENRTPQKVGAAIVKHIEEKAADLKKAIDIVLDEKLYQLQDAQEVIDHIRAIDATKHVYTEFFKKLIESRFKLHFHDNWEEFKDFTFWRFLDGRATIKDYLAFIEKREKNQKQKYQESADEKKAGIIELFSLCQQLLGKGYKVTKNNLTKVFAPKYRLTRNTVGTHLEIYGKKNPDGRLHGGSYFFQHITTWEDDVEPTISWQKADPVVPSHWKRTRIRIDKEQEAAYIMLYIADLYRCMSFESTYDRIYHHCRGRKLKEYIQAIEKNIDIAKYYFDTAQEVAARKAEAPRDPDKSQPEKAQKVEISEKPTKDNSVKSENTEKRIKELKEEIDYKQSYIDNAEPKRTKVIQAGKSYINTLNRKAKNLHQSRIDNFKDDIEKAKRKLVELTPNAQKETKPEMKKENKAVCRAAISTGDVSLEIKLLSDFMAMLDSKQSVKSIRDILTRLQEAKIYAHDEFKPAIEAAYKKAVKINDYMQKNVLDEIEIIAQDKAFAENLADTISQSNYFNTAKFNEKEQCFALNYPISSIHTDPKRFQNRKNAFSEISATNVAQNFDPNKFDPVVVWTDPKDSKVYILSGHSRHEGLIRRKVKTIPVRFFQGTETEAIQFAKVEANRSQERENLAEDIQAFRIMRDGDKAKRISPSEKQEIKRVFREKFNKLDHFSNLNPNGLFIQALSQNSTEYPYIERTASWLGILRKSNPRITNLMEDNCFNFFYADPQGKNIKIAKDDFMKLVNNRLSTMKSSEKLLFTQDGKTIDKAKSLIEDKLKGDGFKRLKEVNDLLKFMSDRLQTTDRKLRVWTKEEEAYIKGELTTRLNEEKSRLERDLNYLDEQKALFGLAGCQYWKCAVSQGPKCECSGCMGSEHGLGDLKVKVCECKPCQQAFKKALSGLVASKKTKKKDCKGCKEKPKKSTSRKAVKKHKPVVKKKALSRKNQALAGLEYESAVTVDMPATVATVISAADTPAIEQPQPQADILKKFKKANQAPEVERETFTLPGKVGLFMGRIERFEYAVVLRGDRGAGKSTLVFRLLDSFADWGLKSAFLSLEMNPESSVFKSMLEKYVKPANQDLVMTTDTVNTVEAINEVAKHFPVVVIDSWTKVQNVKQDDFDKIRKAHPNTIFIVIFQSTTAGTARSGFMAEFDAGAVIHVFKTEKQGGRAVMVKNRYSEGENLEYYVHKNEIIDQDKAPKELAEEML